MENLNLKTIGILVLACLVAGFIGAVIGNAGKVPAPLGATYYNRLISFDAGIAAQGTEIINSSGVYIGAISGTTGAFSAAITGATTLTMTGETNLDTLVFGGDVTTIASSTTNLTAANLCDSAVLIQNIDASTTTLYLPTADALVGDCLAAAGDSKMILFQNSNTGSSTTITIAATTTATAVTLLEHVGGDVTIEDLEWAYLRVTYIAETGTSVVASVIVLQDD